MDWRLTASFWWDAGAAGPTAPRDAPMRRAVTRQFVVR
jgi:hypothetical protein